MTTSMELASGHVIYGSPSAIAAVDRIIGLSAARLKALDAANRELEKTQQWIDRDDRRYLAMVDTATHFKKLAENRMPPAPFANVPSYEFAPKYVMPASSHFPMLPTPQWVIHSASFGRITI